MNFTQVLDHIINEHHEKLIREKAFQILDNVLNFQTLFHCCSMENATPTTLNLHPENVKHIQCLNDVLHNLLKEETLSQEVMSGLMTPSMGKKAQITLQTSKEQPEQFFIRHQVLIV